MPILKKASTNDCSIYTGITPISISEVLVLSRSPVKGDIRVNGEPLRQVKKVKYLGIYLTSNERLDTEIFSCVGQAGSVMRELGRCVACKIDLSREAKLSLVRVMFVPIFTYGNEI